MVLLPFRRAWAVVGVEIKRVHKWLASLSERQELEGGLHSLARFNGSA
jgi:hypothetical protein